MNNYAEAITIFDSIQDDEKKHELLLEILKICPSAIVKAHRNINPTGLLALSEFEKGIREVALGENKITAIKVYRAATNEGLKEAKERVEYLMELLP